VRPAGGGAVVTQPTSNDMLDAAATTTGASILAGGIWKTTSTLVPQFYVLAQSVAAARFLGPRGMGLQSFIAFAEIAVVTLVASGFSVALMRYIGETLGRGEPEPLRALVRWAWRVLGGGAVAGGGILVVAAAAGADPRAAWLLAAVAGTVGILHTVPSAVLIGAQRWREASIVGLVTGTTATAATIVVLALGGGIVGMFAVEAATAVLNLLWTGAYARRAFPRVAAVAPSPLELRRDVLRYALVATASSVLTFVVWRRSELFFLKRYSTDDEIAFYSIAFASVTALTAIPIGIAGVITPAIATLFGAGAETRIRTAYTRGLRLLLFLGLPLTAAGLALGPTALRLVYGDSYKASGSVLLILLAPFPLIPIVYFSRAFMTGLGRLKAGFVMNAFAAAVNVALDFALIPGRGAVGAAIANSCAQVIAGLPVLIYMANHLEGVQLRARAIARNVVAAGAAGLIAWGLVRLIGGAGGLVVGLAAGILAFAALGRVLRVLPDDDAAWLDQAVGERAGGKVGHAVRFFGGTR
jgi:O-antigen/teichoic acid export membrane protein